MRQTLPSLLLPTVAIRENSNIKVILPCVLCWISEESRKHSFILVDMYTKKIKQVKEDTEKDDRDYPVNFQNETITDFGSCFIVKNRKRNH